MDDGDDLVPDLAARKVESMWTVAFVTLRREHMDHYAVQNKFVDFDAELGWQVEEVRFLRLFNDYWLWGRGF